MEAGAGGVIIANASGDTRFALPTRGSGAAKWWALPAANMPSNMLGVGSPARRIEHSAEGGRIFLTNLCPCPTPSSRNVLYEMHNELAKRWHQFYTNGSTPLP